MATKSLNGKVAVVTGASKGIGAEIARHLAAAGASVIVNYSTSREGAERVVKQIKDAGGKAVAVGANVAKPEEIKTLFTETKKAFGPADIVVNNAGVYAFQPLEGIDAEHFYRHFDLNVLGLLLTTQAAVEQFGNRGGSIINIGSAVSTFTPPGSAVYTATKASVDVITRVLSKELGPKKIRVNSVNPGMVETEGTTSAGFTADESDFKKQIEQLSPLGRIGKPDDIAPAVVFLASEDSKFITGETFVVSGGIR